MKSANIKLLSGLELHITAWSLATSNPKPPLHDYKLQSDSLAAYILVIVHNTIYLWLTTQPQNCFGVGSEEISTLVYSLSTL